MLKEKSRKIIIALLWTAMTVVLFFWNNASFQFSYYFAEQLRMFEWDSTYAWSTLLQPMGLVIYGADFLTQFYHLPYMGALVAAFIFLVLSLGFRGLCYRQGVSPLYAGLAFLPGIVLTILGENQFYHLENSLAMVNVVLLLNLYIRIRGQWWRATLLVLGSWLLYYTSGAGFLFFLLLAIVSEIRQSSSLRWLSLGLALVGILPVAAFYFHGDLGTASNVFTPFCYMNPRVPLDTVYYSWLLMIAVALLFIISPAPSHTSNKVVLVGAGLIQLAVVFVVARHFYNKSFNAKNYIVMEADHYARRGQWESLLECTSSMDKNLFVMAYRNYALAQLGILADKGLSFPQARQNGLIAPFNNAIPVMLFHTDYNYAIGNIALAQRYAFETLVQSRNMGAPRMLLRLVQTNLILGAYEVAKKYIERLEHTLYYKEEAQRYRQYLYHEELVEQDADLGTRRKGIAGLDGTVEKLPTLNALFRSYQANPNNAVLFQYLCMIAIVEKDLPSLRKLLDIGKNTEMVQHLPLHVQEGMVMFYSETPEQLEELDIDAGVYNRFSEFVGLFSASKQSQQAYNELRYKFKNTLWYYFLFTK